MRFLLFLCCLFQLLFSSIKEVVITHNTNNPPFKFVNEYNQPDGILIDIWKLWSQKTGIKVKFFPATFEDSLRYIENGNADIHAGIFHTPEREKHFLFSKALLPLKYYYFFDNSIPPTFNNLELSSYVIGTPKGFTTTFVKDNFPQFSVKEYKNLPEVYTNFIDGYIKVFVSPIENWKYFLAYNDLENNAYFDVNHSLYVKEYLGAVKIGNEDLLYEINKGLEQISQEEIEKIKNAWFDKFNKQLKRDELILTPEEKAWLEEHKIIRVGVDASWQPFDYVNEDNEHLGISSEYIKYLEKKLGIHFEIVPDIWDEVIKKAKNKEVDILASVVNTGKKRDFLLFTNEYMNIKTVIITQNSANNIYNIQNLIGKKVAIAKGNFIQDLLEVNYPNIKLVLTHNNEDALKAVALGKADAHIGNLSTATYFIEKNMLSNLKIVSELQNQNHKLTIGVRKDWEIFRNIIQKALLTLSKEQKNEFYKKWVKFDKPMIDYNLIWQITLVFIVIIVGTLAWIKRQKRIIQEKEAHEKVLQKLQKELKEALQKAQDATKAKSDFLSNMSHEIRTPMNSILGFTEILSNEISNNVHKDYLNSVKVASKTLLGIINDILDLSKIEAGKLKLNYTAININHIIQEMSVIFSDKLKEKNLTLQFELDDKIPDYVLMDELRFRQILLNLISNAIKFTFQGRITVQTEVTFLEATCSTFNLKLMVKDTGIGIAEQDLEKIFDYFEQLNDENHIESAKGSGLGLAICTKIVNLLGGKMGVQSELNVGSCFEVELYDLHVSSAKEIEHHTVFSPKEYVFEKAKMLIVDDVADNRKLISLFFSNTNIQTFEAANGLEALEFLKTYPVDMVLLDIKMPVLDGYATIDKIKNEYAFKMPVIALTASVMGEDSYKISKYKFDGYLRKPVSQEDLFTEISKFLVHQKISTDEEGEDLTFKPSVLMKKNSKRVLEDIDKFVKECHTIKDKGDFSLVESFANRLIAFAKEYENKELENYCIGLLENVESFEIAKVKTMLNDFLNKTVQLCKELNDV